MTQGPASNTLDTPQAASDSKTVKPPRGKWTFTSILVILIALAGGIVFSYPFAAPWFADLAQTEKILEQQQRGAELDPKVRAELLASAREYNQHLPSGPLRDPYIINESGEAISIEEGKEDYLNQLVVPGGTSADPMSRLIIPKINVDLPIYKGTDDDVLSKGVGHFYGSGLPVGGLSTHTVLTGHSGYVESTLFNDVDQLEIGDVFSLETLGELHHYRVDQIEIVLPTESELLRQVQGKDYVTLFTCTPKLVNSHRLLVRGERIDGPEAESASSTIETVFAAPQVGFPWWAFLVIGPAVGAFFLVRPRRKKTAEPEPAHPAAQPEAAAEL